MVLALFGVSNGAIQFMTYEELKRWRIEQKVREGMVESEAKNLVSPCGLVHSELLIVYVADVYSCSMNS